MSWCEKRTWNTTKWDEEAEFSNSLIPLSIYFLAYIAAFSLFLCVPFEFTFHALIHTHIDMLHVHTEGKQLSPLFGKIFALVKCSWLKRDGRTMKNILENVRIDFLYIIIHNTKSEAKKSIFCCCCWTLRRFGMLRSNGMGCTTTFLWCVCHFANCIWRIHGMSRMAEWEVVNGWI